MAFTDNIKEISPALADIKSNTPVIVVNGKVLVNGVGGNFIPAGTKTQSFYKCASVGTGTWSGYLASVDPVTGVWSFAETATTGLTFDRITPVVGKVYDEGCTFRVEGYKTGLPEAGLIFYLALADEIGDTDDTGTYTLNKISTSYSFTTRNGIPCVQLNPVSRVLGPDLISVLPNSSSTRFTISFWGATTNYDSGSLRAGFQYSTGNSSSFAVGFAIEESYSNYAYNGYNNRLGSSDNTVMAHYLVTYNGSSLDYYRNGQRLLEMPTSTPYGSYSTIYPGFLGEPGGGYITAFRVYDRVLDSSEIDALAAEFTPTAS